jgi:spermidine synthase
MIRVLALGLTVLTGFSALVYEVAWQKYLATLLGSHSEATAAVLGLFLGGLALGYALFGRATHAWLASARARAAPPRLLLAYGLVETSIGVYALLFPLLFRAAQALSLRLPLGSSGLGFGLDVLLSALLIGPPAVLMGATIPILTQALARDLQDATRIHALVYALNTVGAFLGALAAGFWIVPALGLVGALVAMACLNLFAGATFVALGRHPTEPTAALAHTSATAPATAPGFAAFCAIALLVGFAMMAVQTVAIRVGGLSFGASQLTFSMVVAVFVLCIALGSLGVSALPRIPRVLLAATLWALVATLALLYPQIPDAPYWAHLLRLRFPLEPAAFVPYHLAAFAGVLLAIGAPVVLSGATLPLIFDQLRRHTGELGDMAGRVYSWNTFGSLLGALLGGYALLFWLDLQHVFQLALGALAGAAVLATQRLLPPGRRRLAAALLPAAALVALLPPWPPVRLSSGLFRVRRTQPFTFAGPDEFFRSYLGRREVRFYDDDPVASIALVSQTQDELAVLVDGKPDSAVPGDYGTTGLLALIPALLAEKTERAFVIGYATGVTAGELARLEKTREVMVAEISSAVIRAAPHFDFANGDASHNPVLRIVPGDAYRTLLRSDGRFDLIVSGPSNPWVAGVEMLYSREFLEAARDRLAPGGVHAQWFHAYETDAETIALVLRTYAAVFEHASLWYLVGPDLLLIGMHEPASALDVRRLALRFVRPDFAAGFRRAGIHSLPALLAHEMLPMGVLHAVPLPGPQHTLLHPRLGYRAARAFFAGQEASLPSTAQPAAVARGARSSLVRRYIAWRRNRLPEAARERIVRETCTHQGAACVALLAQWTHEVPHSALRDRLVLAMRRHPIISKRTPLELVEPLSHLFADTGTGPVSIEEAIRASELFARHYHHAAPFSGEALAAIWRRCISDPVQRERCLAARDEAIRSLQAPGG